MLQSGHTQKPIRPVNPHQRSPRSCLSARTGLQLHVGKSCVVLTWPFVSEGQKSDVLLVYFLIPAQYELIFLEKAVISKDPKHIYLLILFYLCIKVRRKFPLRYFFSVGTVCGCPNHISWEVHWIVQASHSERNSLFLVGSLIPFVLVVSVTQDWAP